MSPRALFWFGVASALLGTLGCTTSELRVAPPAPSGDTAPRQPTPDAPPASAPHTGSPPEVEARPDDPKPESIAVPGSDYVHGRTTTVVAAPMKQVREAILDFPHYAEFMPHYESCRVLGRTPDGARDVYMEIEALHGLVKMWAELEMPKPTTENGVETHVSRFVKGNVKDFKAVWRLKKLDEARTELSLEVFLEPSLPLPTGLVNSENLKGSLKGLLAMKAHAEKR